MFERSSEELQRNSPNLISAKGLDDGLLFKFMRLTKVEDGDRTFRIHQDNQMMSALYMKISSEYLTMLLQDEPLYKKLSAFERENARK
jgi:hypothetical protein